MAWRSRYRKEDTLCGISHFTCVIVAILLAMKGTTFSGLVFFCVSAITFLMSTCYHLCPTSLDALKDRIRRLDIATIYLLVAASTVAFLPPIVFLPIWLVATVLAMSVTSKVMLVKESDVILPLFATLSTLICVTSHQQSDVIRLLASTAIYGIGTFFYISDFMRWHHLVWHFFVMLAWAITASVYL